MERKLYFKVTHETYGRASENSRWKLIETTEDLCPEHNCEHYILSTKGLPFERSHRLSSRRAKYTKYGYRKHDTFSSISPTGLQKTVYSVNWNDCQIKEE